MFFFGSNWQAEANWFYLFRKILSKYIQLENIYFGQITKKTEVETWRFVKKRGVSLASYTGALGGRRGFANACRKFPVICVQKPTLVPICGMLTQAMQNTPFTRLRLWTLGKPQQACKCAFRHQATFSL